MWSGKVSESSTPPPTATTLKRARQFILDDGPPSTMGLVQVAGATFVLAVCILLVLRPPMVMTKPDSEYRAPALSVPSVIVWSALAAAAGAGVRFTWN